MTRSTEKSVATDCSCHCTAAAISSLSFTLRDPSLLPISSGGKRDVCFDVINPADSSVIAEIECMDGADARKAIETCAKALPLWKDDTTGAYRGNILSRWSELIQQNADDLAKIMTLETGKPLTESLVEVSYAASFLSFYAGEVLRPTCSGGGSILPTPFTHPSTTSQPRGKLLLLKEAIGVTAMITPWNFPLAMVTRKAGPALAAGCTVVMKPSDLTPLSAIAVKVLSERAGLPKEVFQLVTASPETTAEVGKELCENPIVRQLSFTGSTAVGKLLMKQCSDTVKRLSFELGGNAPFIVFEDADIDQAVSAALASKFRNAGQACISSDRFLLHESVEDMFLSKFLAAISEKIRVGNGLKEGITTGPLITSGAAKTIRNKIDEAIKEGAELLLGDKTLVEGLGPNFIEPTVLRNVDTNSRLWKTETFGPVAAIRTFKTEDEAIELANDTWAGLASYFCSQNMKRVFRVMGKLENGIVGVNEGILNTANAPFGGVKESGLGREGSSVGMEEYLEMKYVLLNA